MKKSKIFTNHATFEIEKITNDCIFVWYESNKYTRELLTSPDAFESLNEAKRFIKESATKLEFYVLLESHLESINTNRLGEDSQVIFPQSLAKIAIEISKIAIIKDIRCPAK
jgi:hypothetical protein